MSSVLASLAVAMAFQVAPAQVEIVAPRSEVEVQESLLLTARAIDGAGRVMDDVLVRWISSTPEIAEVDQTGRVLATNPGTARITAVIGGRPTSTLIVIRELGAATVVAELAYATPFAGQAVPLRVSTLNRLGEAVANPVFTYQSDNDAIAHVDGAGLVFARSQGTTRLSVRSGDASTRVEVIVRADPGLTYSLTPEQAQARTGDVIRLHAAMQSPDGEVRAFPEWSVSGTGAQVEDDDGEGVFVAERPGTYRVSARLGENAVVSAVIQVEARGAEAELIKVGRGPISAHHSGDVWVFEGVDGRDYAYIGTFQYDWMKVWDVTDSSNPILTDSVQMDARRINDVKIHPNARLGIVTREGASSRRNGIVLLDLSSPAHPTILSEYTETLTGGVHNVWIDGENELVYAVHNGTRAVHVIDISNPESPSEVGRWAIDDAPRSLHDVIVQDGYAYVSYWDDGAIILDVGAGTHGGTPRQPTFVSQFKYPIGNTHVAWRHGKYLFLGDEIFPPAWDVDGRIDARGYLHVLDMSDIENPVEVARYEVPEAGVHNIWAEGDRLYVAYYQAGLRVLDISGELRGDLYRQGREIATILTTDGDTTTPNWPMAWGAQIHKGKIYSSDINSGLWITELKERPRVIS